MVTIARVVPRAVISRGQHRAPLSAERSRVFDARATTRVICAKRSGHGEQTRFPPGRTARDHVEPPGRPSCSGNYLVRERSRRRPDGVGRDAGRRPTVCRRRYMWPISTTLFPPRAAVSGSFVPRAIASHARAFRRDAAATSDNGRDERITTSDVVRSPLDSAASGTAYDPLTAAHSSTCTCCPEPCYVTTTRRVVINCYCRRKKAFLFVHYFFFFSIISPSSF